jgi:hypothetical protein
LSKKKTFGIIALLLAKEGKNILVHFADFLKGKKGGDALQTQF